MTSFSRLGKRYNKPLIFCRLVNNNGYLTVKIVQCNARGMRSLNLSQTNRYNLCDTFQIKYPV